MNISTIFHPTDFSDSAHQALKVAVYLAVSHRARLHVFHARLLHAADPAVEGPELEAYLDEARFQARAWVEHDPDGRLEIDRTQVRALDVFDAVMDAIATLGPDVVVMGTHGRSGVGKLVMGSHTDKLLRHAPCDVITVRAEAKPPAPAQGFRRILVPVDFSEPSKRAFEAAREIARGTGGRLTLAHVVSTVVSAHYAALVDSAYEMDPLLLSAAERTLQTWAKGFDVDIALAEGLASIEIVRMAAERDADLIVMGTRGLTGLEHVLVGSVTERVCRAAPAPVFVVK